MSKFWVIVTDVYRKNLKSISFWVMLLTPFLMAGLIFVVGYFAAGGFDDDSTVGIITNDSALVAGAKETLTEQDITLQEFKDVASAKKALTAEELDGYLEVTVKDGTVTGKLTSSSDLGTSVTGTMSGLLTQYQQSLQMEKLNLSADDVATLSAPATFTTERVKIEDGETVSDTSNTAVQTAVSFILVILVFFVVLTYASLIAQEVASEKGTRIMEVILSSTTAQVHFYGKIVGVLLVALTQFGLYAVAFGIGWPLVKAQPVVKSVLQSINLSSLLGTFLVYCLLYFFLGVMIYSVLAALCGSLVNKAEDVPKAVIPITYLSMAGYLIGISLGASDPQNIVVKVTSFIPFLSSYTMPIRIATATVSNSQIFISLIILALSLVGLTLFAARMYKANVLVYSEGGLFKSVKQALIIMKNEKAHN